MVKNNNINVFGGAWTSPKGSKYSVTFTCHLTQVNQVPVCLAGLKAGCVHLCPMAGNTV